MSKFHINKHGVPAPCRATKGNCPYGGEESHFKTQEEAQAHADKIHESQHSLLPGMNDDFGVSDEEIQLPTNQLRLLSEKGFKDNTGEIKERLKERDTKVAEKALDKLEQNDGSAIVMVNDDNVRVINSMGLSKSDIKQIELASGKEYQKKNEGIYDWYDAERRDRIKKFEAPRRKELINELNTTLDNHFDEGNIKKYNIPKVGEEIEGKDLPLGVNDPRNSVMHFYENLSEELMKDEESYVDYDHAMYEFNHYAVYGNELWDEDRTKDNFELVDKLNQYYDGASRLVHDIQKDTNKIYNNRDTDRRLTQEYVFNKVYQRISNDYGFKKVEGDFDKDFIKY